MAQPLFDAIDTLVQFNSAHTVISGIKVYSFLLFIRNRLIFSGLELVLIHTKKLCLESIISSFL